jgi:hypothetical protein
MKHCWIKNVLQKEVAGYLKGDWSFWREEDVRVGGTCWLAMGMGHEEEEDRA